MKLTFTKDYQPTAEQVLAEMAIENLPVPTKIDVTGSAVDMEFAEELLGYEKAKLTELLVSFGYFLNR